MRRGCEAGGAAPRRQRRATRLVCRHAGTIGARNVRAKLERRVALSFTQRTSAQPPRRGSCCGARPPRARPARTRTARPPSLAAAAAASRGGRRWRRRPSSSAGPATSSLAVSPFASLLPRTSAPAAARRRQAQELTRASGAPARAPRRARAAPPWGRPRTPARRAPGNPLACPKAFSRAVTPRAPPPPPPPPRRRGCRRTTRRRLRSTRSSCATRRKTCGDWRRNATS